MKVLHINTEKPWRGGEQQMAYLIRELASRGVSNHVMGRRHSRLESYCQKNEIPYRSFTWGNVRPLNAIQMIAEIKSEKFDLVHAHSSNAHTIAHLAKLCGSRCPLVVSKRTSFPIRRPRKYSTASAIVCVSDRIKQETVSKLGTESRIHTVYDGIDLHRFETEQTNLKQQLSLEGKVIVGNASAISREKDYQTFLRTAQYLLKNSSIPYHFLVMGTGPQEQEIQELARSLGIAENVTFLGFVNDIDRKLKNIDIFLMPSKVEGLGSSILDAMICRIPVVATNVGGIPEIVRHQDTGLLSESGDFKSLATHIDDLSHSPQIREKLTKNAYQMVCSRFSVSRTAEQTLEIYHKVL